MLRVGFWFLNLTIEDFDTAVSAEGLPVLFRLHAET